MHKLFADQRGNFSCWVSKFGVNGRNIKESLKLFSKFTEKVQICNNTGIIMDKFLAVR